MNKKTWLPIIVVLVIVLGAIVVAHRHVKSKAPQIDTNQIILFYGTECPHCKKTEKFIKDYDLHNKIKFLELEVYHNQQNYELFVKIVRGCKNISKYVELPIMWTGNSCLLGNEQIISFFKEQMNVESKILQK